MPFIATKCSLLSLLPLFQTKGNVVPDIKEHIFITRGTAPLLHWSEMSVQFDRPIALSKGITWRPLYNKVGHFRESNPTQPPNIKPL